MSVHLDDAPEPAGGIFESLEVAIAFARLAANDPDELVVLHRAYEGIEHERTGDACWCGPVMFPADDMRDDGYWIALLEAETVH